MRLANLLGLLGLLALIGLILIYILKPQYEDRKISSTYVWKLSLRYRKRKMPWEWPLKSLLIILQVLIIAMIAFLMAQPEVFAKESDGEKIVILDASVSMMAEYNGKTRFETAIDKIQALANDTVPEYKFSVVLASESPAEVIRRSDSSADIRRALEGVSCSYMPADINNALILARTIKEENPDANIYVVTDQAHDASLNVEIINVKNSAEWNVAVLDFTARVKEGFYEFNASVAHYDGKGPSGPGGNYVVTLEVMGKNPDTNPAVPSAPMHSIKWTQEITLKDAEPVDISFWEFKNSSGVKDTSGMILQYQWASVTIAPKSGPQDGYAFDDQNYLFGGRESKFKVQIVTPMKAPNFLHSAFISLKNCTIDMPTADEFTGVIDFYTSGYDLYIFDRYMPARKPTDGSVWFIGETTPIETGLPVFSGIKTNIAANPDGSKGWQLQPAGVDHLAVDVVMKNVDLTKTHVTRYATINDKDIPADYTVLARCEGDAVMLASGKQNEYKTIVTMFDFQMSDFPVKFFDFPVLIGNISKYCVPPIVDKYTYTIGEYFRISPRANTTKIVYSYYTDMSDKTSIVSGEFVAAADGQFSITPVMARYPGMYTITLFADDREQKEFAENFYVRLDPAEGDFSDPGKAVIVEDSSKSETLVEVVKDLFIYFAVALFVFLILEWWVQYREQF